MAARTQSTKHGPKRPWAFAVYIAGDNNLSEFGLSDISEMCQEGSSARLHVGVEIDTYGDHTGSIRYEVSEPDWTGHAHPIELERLPERNTGDPVVLSDFLKWAAKRFYADNRLYVIWNHGSGFRTVRRDIAYDDFGSSLDMPEIVGAMERAGITPAKPIQILGFDACLMNMVEIVNHFHGLVEIVVGSEQTEPGQGWPYDKVLALLKTAANPAVAGAGIVKAYIDYYRRTRQPNVTQPAVDVK